MTVAFGEVSLGEHQDKTVTLTNVGECLLTINGVGMADGSSGDFDCSPCDLTSFPIRLIPHGSTDVTVTYAPQQIGEAHGALLIASAVAFGMVWHHGAQVWWEDDPVRLTVTGVLLAGLGVFAVYFLLVGVWASQESGKLDERDRAILARAPAGVGGAMMVVMAVWMIALTEGFRPTGGQMPTYFLYLIFWSCVMVNAMAHIGGVLIASAPRSRSSEPRNRRGRYQTTTSPGICSRRCSTRGSLPSVRWRIARAPWAVHGPNSADGAGSHLAYDHEPSPVRAFSHS